MKSHFFDLLKKATTKCYQRIEDDDLYITLTAFEDITDVIQEAAAEVVRELTAESLMYVFVGIPEYTEAIIPLSRRAVENDQAYFRDIAQNYLAYLLEDAIAMRLLSEFDNQEAVEVIRMVHHHFLESE